MIPITVSTIDELLKLGGKIADIVTLLLSRRANKEEQERASSVVQEFNQLKQTHLQIKKTLEEYNRGFGQAIVYGGVQALFVLCTHQGFKDAEGAYAREVDAGVRNQELIQFELLSVKLITRSVNEASSISSKSATERLAEAYTHERWVSIYQAGARRDSDVVDRYHLIWQDSQWKIESCEVFSRLAEG